MENGYTDGLYWVRGTGYQNNHEWDGPFGDIDNARYAAIEMWEKWRVDLSSISRERVSPVSLGSLSIVEIGKRTWQAFDCGDRRKFGRWNMATEDVITEGNYSDTLTETLATTADTLTVLIDSDTVKDNNFCYGDFDEDFCSPCDEFQEAIDSLPPMNGQDAIQNIRILNAFENDGTNFIAPEIWVATGGAIAFAYEPQLPAYNPNGGMVPGRYLDNIKLGVFVEAELQTETGYGNGEPGGIGYEPIVFPTDPTNPEHWRLRLSWIGEPFQNPDTAAIVEQFGLTGYRDLRNRGIAYPVPTVPDFTIMAGKIPITNGGKSYNLTASGNLADVLVFAGSKAAFLSAYAGIKPWKVRAYLTLTWDVVDAGGPKECEYRTHWYSRQFKVSAQSANQSYQGQFSTYPWDIGFFGGTETVPTEPEPERRGVAIRPPIDDCYRFKVPHPGYWVEWEFCPNAGTVAMHAELPPIKPGLTLDYTDGSLTVDLGIGDDSKFEF